MSYLGESIKKLGFGLMRLPMIGEKVDIEQTKKMVDYFMENGFTYFDTAYVYINGTSEVAMKEALVERYPRDSYQAATKLPLHSLKTTEDMPPYFEESLKRAGLEYFDFYLLHAISAGSYAKTNEIGAWDYLKKLKAEGRIKHMGFSYHDNAELLDQILTEHPETEFVQLQINYIDWDDETVQSRKCYEVARKHDVPVIIMEPVKGGALAGMNPQIQDIYKKANPDMSVASWAMRYAASLEGVITVLSGMSDEAQMVDNCKVLKDMKPLGGKEREAIDEVVEILKNTPTISCTDCKYCVDDCPQNINIPSIISNINNYTLYDNLPGAKRSYGFSTNERGSASDCIECGACESRCPQHIEIIEHMKKAASLFE